MFAGRGDWSVARRSRGRELETLAKSLTYRILEEHLVSGNLEPGTEIGIRIDQTLTQDATGTMAYLQFEAMGIPRVRTKLSVSYIDHNMLQSGFENADDHRFLQGIAAKYGIYFSRPGNGICHQVHLERFGVPGQTLVGSDSHTPTGGGLGMVAIGAGGLDVAVAMGGQPFYIIAPRVVLVHLTGSLPPWVSGKDVILEVLRRQTVKGGLGRVFEYGGPGVETLSVPERATITNMGAELGATTSIFPSDERTREYLHAQKREEVWRPLAADPDAEYDEVMEIDLSTLEPLVACPSSPDAVVPVRELAGTEVTQVCVGSCTNSSYHDLMVVAGVLKGQTVHPQVSMTISPGSRQVFTMIARSGALADLIEAGARILESACGPCIGMGQAPPTDGASLRTFNRNFPSRSGTPDDRVHLASPEVAAATALRGVISDPRELGEPPRIELPREFFIDDSMIIPPVEKPEEVEIVRGPNIAPLPLAEPMPEVIRGELLLKVGDNISTDTILPAGAKVLPLRSNIPEISKYVFNYVDWTFPQRAKQAGASMVAGGANYGQGSSREHAALAPMYLGVKAVFAKTFARMHHTNLINFGILPLRFVDEADYERLNPGDVLLIANVRQAIGDGNLITVRNITQGYEFTARHDLTSRQVEIALAGGLLNKVRSSQS
jgi:aconitate hydratase